MRGPGAVQQDGFGAQTDPSSRCRFATASDARRPAAPSLLEASVQDAVGELSHGGAALRAVLVDLRHAGVQCLVGLSLQEENQW